MTPNPVQHTPPPESYSTPPVTIILTVILLLLLFVGFFSVYFCKYIMQNLIYTWHRHSPTGTPIGPATGARGLDPSIIDSFPSFPYASVKDFRREKYGLECAICLCEFEDHNILRLLTSCCHVFHQECIDLWLESHNTCPVCRRSLDIPLKSPNKSPVSISENESLEDQTFSITIKDDNEEERRGRGKGDLTEAASTARQGEGDDNKVEKFPRSNSTGHSIARVREGEDRFTLRLPEHVKAKFIRGHNWTRSCTTFGEYKCKISTGNGGFGEVSGLPGGDTNKV